MSVNMHMHVYRCVVLLKNTIMIQKREAAADTVVKIVFFLFRKQNRKHFALGPGSLQAKDYNSLVV